jgi:hypothetical protein
MRNHYHVLTGLPGYMPDDNQTFTSRRDAERYAVSMKRDYLELNSIDDPFLYRARGAAASGRIDIIRNGWHALPVVITIDPCDDRVSCSFHDEDEYA